jgi:hypothetical protein
MEKLKILGCDYEMTEVDQVARNEFKFGEVDHVEQIIRISRSLKPHRKAETIVHEVLHCLLFEMGEVELHDNEAFINMLSAMLIQVLRDNPKLLAFLSGLHQCDSGEEIR